MAAIQQEMSEQMAVIMDQDAGMSAQWGHVMQYPCSTTMHQAAGTTIYRRAAQCG
jgi:hypothetical protein